MKCRLFEINFKTLTNGPNQGKPDLSKPQTKPGEQNELAPRLSQESHRVTLTAYASKQPIFYCEFWMDFEWAAPCAREYARYKPSLSF